MCIGVLLYFYVWGFINPCLLCYRRFPLFLTTRDFLVEHLLRPGGPAEYLSHFLRQSCCDRWVGSAVIVAGLALVGLTAHGLLKACFCFTVDTRTRRR